jgi:poly-gamma-glutamate synthesis protein (capsule biosynthesis protein)
MRGRLQTRRNLVLGCLLILLGQLLLGGCLGQSSSTSRDRLKSETVAHNDAAPTTDISPTTLPTVEVAVTPTKLVTSTPMPVQEVRLFVPKFLERRALAATLELGASTVSWRWRLANAADQADISLEPDNGGISAGYRAIALTVPFDANWDEITAEEAVRIVDTGHENVAIMDWANMPTDRKALRIDGLLPSDRNYPLQQEWTLTAADGFETAAGELAPHLRNTLPNDDVIQIAAVGDLMLDRAIGYALENDDLDFPFGAVSGPLASADIAVGNLESALGDSGQPQKKRYTFQAPPAAVDALAQAGFDLLSLANNHALDYGPEALQQGLELLHQAGIATAGAGLDAKAARAPVIFEANGLTTAFLSYVDVPVEYSGFDTRSWAATDDRPGLAWAEATSIREDVTAAAGNSDLVVVLLHSGYEYVQAPSPEQTTAARAALDAGADLVLGHHAHVLQGIEFRSNSAIIYGLGNFAFEIDGDPTTLIASIWLDSDGVRQIELLPAIIEAGGRPRLAAPWEAFEIRQQVYSLTRLLNRSP